MASAASPCTSAAVIASTAERNPAAHFTVYGQWLREAFELEGELRTYEGRGFCPPCGSRLVCLDEDVVEVRLGSLDEAPFELQPEAEIWIKRREPWLHAVEGASQHDENHGPRIRRQRCVECYAPLRSISSTR
jgi:hypothetical protein